MSPSTSQSFAMKHWQETHRIAGRITAAAGAQGIAVATVVQIEGSAYRRPGAKLLVEDTGDLLGGVSGGCLEADVREVGLEAIRGGSACVRRYDTGTDEDTVWGLGLGCEGRVEVFVQPVTPSVANVWQAIDALLDGERSFAIATPLDGPAAGRSVVVDDRGHAQGTTGDAELDRALTERAATHLSAGESFLEPLGATRVFTEVLLPPPWLVVFGAGDDAMPLVELASGLGFRVAIVDHRPAFVTADRFPSAHRCITSRPDVGVDELPIGPAAAAVVATHSLAHDTEWVRALVDTPISYIGVLGPRTRIARILDAVGRERDERLFGPVGLDLGADGPEQIAVSIMAEVLAVRSGRSAKHLRARGEAIHV